MNTRRKLHPLMAITAVSLTVFSLMGIGAITGVIPSARSNNASSFQVAMPISEADAKKLEAQDQPQAPALANPVGKEPSSGTSKPSTKVATAEPAVIRHGTSGKASAKPAAAAANEPIKSCPHCGQVASINMVKQDGEASGLGAVAGGVAGGVLGNQIGKGKGNVLMTILGAGGGAYAGHTIEKKVKGTETYVVKVHMNDGSTRTVTMADKPEFAVGDQVKVINGGVSVVS